MENGTIEQRINTVKKQRLVKLDLSSHTLPGSVALKEIPPEVFELSQLNFLKVSRNQIESIPESIANLINLQHLDLSDNRLTHVPKSISQLSNLTALSLSGNRLTAFPESILDLRELEWLDLSRNAIATIPNTISKLQKLNGLDLQNNLLASVPEAVFHLTNLNNLNLSDNDLTYIPESISQLVNLELLHLYRTGLGNLPLSIRYLRKLKRLDLWDNRFISIPDVIYELSSLESLSFDNNSRTGLYKHKNQIKEISPKVLLLGSLKQFSLQDNPVQNPPPEIVQKGIEAIRNYFRQLEAGRDYLYEAKLIIVGEAGAGKTTFANKIKNPDFKLLEEQRSTEGIEVLKWAFPLNSGQLFRVNIWDFGGQEIYHATHQFFLTKRSLYTLVADSRKEDTDFYYWLNIVELLSDSSPLIIIKNEKQDRHREINERFLRGQFANLKETLATNFATDRGLSRVISEIKHYISTLSHIGTPLPETWVKVRETLENDPRNFISIDEFFDICQRNGFKKTADKLQLSSYLHDLGVCLHFQSDPLLKNSIILKPKWGTDAVYKVLDNKQVISNFGKFNKPTLIEIWDEPDYAGMEDQLLRLMINFRLCYMISHDYYIAPQLLSVNQPSYNWDKSNNLIVRYTYEFMPKGLLTQLIVVMHSFIADESLVWKAGVVIKKDETMAEIIEHYDKREIKIRVSGKHKRDLITIVTYELEKIHSSYKSLKYSKLIPCNCAKCKNNQEPGFYGFETLQRFLGDKEDYIQCQRSYRMVDVRALIDDIVTTKLFFKGDDTNVVYRDAFGTLIIEYSRFGGGFMDYSKKAIKGARSAWANGSFYLFCFAVVIVLLGALANFVPFYTLAAVLIAGLLFVPIIGALQLRQDSKLSEKPFIELMKIAIGQLPLISKMGKQNQTNRQT